jgi:hypothetical protein
VTSFIAVIFRCGARLPATIARPSRDPRLRGASEQCGSHLLASAGWFFAATAARRVHPRALRARCLRLRRWKDSLRGFVVLEIHQPIDGPREALERNRIHDDLFAAGIRRDRDTDRGISNRREEPDASTRPFCCW